MTPRILLLLLLLAGLAFRVAHFDDPSPPIVFTSSPRPPSWEEHVRSVGLAGPLALLASGPPQSKELVPPWRPTDLQLPPRRSPAQSHLVLEPEPGIRELRYDNDGTIKLVDSRSQSTLWQFSTGSPLSNYQITTARPDLRYLIYAVNETHLYEVHEQHGAVKLWTIDDFVARTPQVRDSVITIGSKASTVFVVNADNGEIIYKHSLPVDLSELAVPLVEETPSKLDDGRSGSNTNIMVIVRTDYSLSASDLGDHLFNWTRTTFTAKFYTKYDHPDMLDESPCLQGDIPVRCIRSEGQGLLKLPLPESTSIALKYMNEVTFGDNASAPELGQSLEESPETADKTNVMLDSAQNETVDGSLIHIISTDPELTTVSSKSVYVLLFVVVLLLVVMACLLSMTDADKSYGRFVTQLMKPIAYDKKLMNSREKLDGTPKKRKARKKDVVVNSPESSSPSDKESSGTDRPTETQINEKYTLIKNMKPLDGRDGRWVGKLFVSNVEIGRGSNGTVVLEGFYDGRPVAVKRLLHSHNDIALKEIQNLIASDQDPNIVRLYGVEQDYDFVYISLERCSCSFADLIQQHSDSSSRDLNSNYQITFSLQLKDSKVMQKNVELWRPDGLPSVQLLKLMRDVVAGLVHLHSLGIIHRDLKPQNVLISMEGPIRAKLSDMGISKRLQDDMTSVSHHGTGFGSSGWQAPEQLRHGRQTRAMDLFSLGCVLFYCISKGKHPFGEYFERDANILNNRFDLFMVDYIPEAVHLLSQLLHPDPEMRPTAVYVFHHPLFWSPELRLSFLRATSDRIDKANETDLVNALESIGPVAFGGKWGEKLDAALVADMGRYRKYNFDSTRDLLRLIRNKSGHYRELPAELQELLGSLPDGFDHYFSSRFPKLLIEVYKVMCVHCKDEEAFSKYF